MHRIRRYTATKTTERGQNRLLQNMNRTNLAKIIIKILSALGFTSSIHFINAFRDTFVLYNTFVDTT